MNRSLGATEKQNDNNDLNDISVFCIKNRASSIIVTDVINDHNV